MCLCEGWYAYHSKCGSQRITFRSVFPLPDFLQDGWPPNLWEIFLSFASHLDIEVGYTLLVSGFCVGSGAVTKVARFVGQHHLQGPRNGVLV